MTEERTPTKLEKYQEVAETIGMIPSVNAKDNINQGLFVLVMTTVAVLIGFFYGFTPAQGLLFSIGGLFLSVFISGFVLMIVGLQRSVKKKKSLESK